jgi:hypothetical protein
MQESLQLEPRKVPPKVRVPARGWRNTTPFETGPAPHRRVFPFLGENHKGQPSEGCPVLRPPLSLRNFRNGQSQQRHTSHKGPISSRTHERERLPPLVEYLNSAPHHARGSTSRQRVSRARTPQHLHPKGCRYYRLPPVREVSKPPMTDGSFFQIGKKPGGQFDRNPQFGRATPYPLNLPARYLAVTQGTFTRVPCREPFGPTIAEQTRCLQPLANRDLSKCLVRASTSLPLPILLSESDTGFCVGAQTGFIPLLGTLYIPFAFATWTCGCTGVRSLQFPLASTCGVWCLYGCGRFLPH